ncbi:small ribosomal subunit protein uS12m [Panulirus ornatus]|uniref:small ribosomal subunit protein uS12m n=1 Tax=Panulirus ornatus TaxID=150431 RepID=UPI003A86F898
MVLRNLRVALSRLSLLPTISRSNVSDTSRVPQALDWNSTLPNTGTTSTSSITMCMRNTATSSSCNVISSVSPSTIASSTFISQVRSLTTSEARPASLNQMHRTGPIKKIRKNKNPLIDRPFAKGVVLKTLIKKPKKPNSANRKCVLVRLSTGKEMIAHVPGEGHNLQEHNIVLVRPGRLQDVPGVKLKCVRGKYDLQHVIKKKN